MFALDAASADGLRRPPAPARAALRAIETSAAVAPAIGRWRVMAAARAAARPLGLSAPMLTLLELYVDLSWDVDWETGAEPIVTQPMVEIAERLGRSERQIRNIERALAERGLLVWRDSGNHHRKGRRDRVTGRLIHAYGPSLEPMRRRFEELLALAAADRAETAERRRLRLAISALRRRIREELAAATSLNSHPTAAEEEARRALEETPRRHAAGVPATELAAIRSRLAAAASALADAMTGATTTIVLPATEGEARKTSGKPETGRPPLPKTMKKDCVNAYEKPKAALPETIRLETAEAAMGPLFTEAYAKSGARRRQALGEAGREVAPWFGVDEGLWRRAETLIGPDAAALCLVLVEGATDRKATQTTTPVTKPRAYFRALLDRASEGRLNLRAGLAAMARRRRETRRQVPGDDAAHDEPAGT